MFARLRQREEGDMIRILTFASVIAVANMAGDASAETQLSVDTITIQFKAGVSLDFVYVPPGEYVVGRRIGRTEMVLGGLGEYRKRLDEAPERRVTFATGFYLARHQITASQFAAFLNDVEPSVAEHCIVLNDRSNLIKVRAKRYLARRGAARYPANTVTWDGAVEFTKWFTTKSGWSVRLPSEDEWEAGARTSRGLRVPTGGGDRRIDPKTGLLPGIRAGSALAEVDAFEENLTVTGLFHTLSSVGDWTSDVYRSDRAKEIPDSLIAEDEGGHVLKRCLNELTERESGGDVGQDGIFGLRVLLEATESGSPLREDSISE